MRSFAYLRDRLFLVCCALYAVNRWILKPHVDNWFLQGYFNDVLLIPCALPPLLLAQRWLKLRLDDEPPRPSEIFFQWAVWSVLFEWIGPRIMRVVGDPWDVVAYAVGGVFAGLWWRRSQWLPRPAAA